MLQTAITAAKSAAEILIDNFGRIRSDDIREKSSNDFLTYVDELTEKKILEIIRRDYPTHSILAEESGQKKKQAEYEWIIDPLDGTKNYISEIPVFAISIGLRHGIDMELGVIFDPIKNDLFYGQKNQGAYLNGNRIRVSSRSSMQECLLATGFPFKKKEKLSSYLKCFEDIFLKCSGVRRMGAAAIDLAYLAAGKFDGFWELGLSPWDIAAGAIIIQEASGTISDFWGKNDYLQSGNIVATNGKIHQKVVNITSKHFLPSNTDID